METQAPAVYATQVYAVVDSGVDGRGQSRIVSIWLTEHLAKLHATNYNTIEPRWGIIAPSGDVYLLVGRDPLPVNVNIEAKMKERREAALSKLSAEDRAALKV